MSHYTDGANLATNLANTYDAFANTDLLQAPVELDELAATHGLGGPGANEDDLNQVRLARRVLRDVYLADSEADAISELNDLLGSVSTRPRLVESDAGGWAFAYFDPTAPLADQLIAASATELLEEIRSHGLARLSTCSSSTCKDVFVDRSRNHSRRYCSPDVCGNRESQRAYRARQADTT